MDKFERNNFFKKKSAVENFSIAQMSRFFSKFAASKICKNWTPAELLASIL